MLKAGYLASILAMHQSYTNSILDSYFEAPDRVFVLIAECEAGRSVDTLLDGPICSSGFKRLN